MTKRLRTLAIVVAAIPVVATVATFGELTVEAFVGVMIAGVAAGAYGLHRRTGSAADPVGHRGAVWFAWLVALGGWEFVMFVHDHGDPAYPTLSDLLDPILAHPPVRAAATVFWLGCGAWLVTRPSAHPSRTTSTRAAGAATGKARASPEVDS